MTSEAGQLRKALDKERAAGESVRAEVACVREALQAERKAVQTLRREAQRQLKEVREAEAAKAADLVQQMKTKLALELAEAVSSEREAAIKSTKGELQRLYQAQESELRKEFSRKEEDLRRQLRDALTRQMQPDAAAAGDNAQALPAKQVTAALSPEILSLRALNKQLDMRVQELVEAERRNADTVRTQYEEHALREAEQKRTSRRETHLLLEKLKSRDRSIENLEKEVSILKSRLDENNARDRFYTEKPGESPRLGIKRPNTRNSGLPPEAMRARSSRMKDNNSNDLNDEQFSCKNSKPLTTKIEEEKGPKHDKKDDKCNTVSEDGANGNTIDKEIQTDTNETRIYKESATNTDEEGLDSWTKSVGLETLYQVVVREHQDLQRAHQALINKLKAEQRARLDLEAPVKVREENPINLALAAQIQELTARQDELISENHDLREQNDLLEFRLLEIDSAPASLHFKTPASPSRSPESRGDREVDDVSDSGVLSLPTSEDISEADFHDLAMEPSSRDIKFKLAQLCLSIENVTDKVSIQQGLSLLRHYEVRLETALNTLSQDTLSVRSLTSPDSVLSSETSKSQSRIIATVLPFTDLSQGCGKQKEDAPLKKLFKDADCLQESGIFEESPEYCNRCTQTECTQAKLETTGDLSLEIRKLKQIQERIEEQGSNKRLLRATTNEASCPSAESKELAFYRDRVEMLENKLAIYESSGDEQIKKMNLRLDREVLLSAEIKHLKERCRILEELNRQLEEEKCEFEEAENDTRLRCQKLEVKLSALGEKKSDLQVQLQQNARTISNLRSCLAEEERKRIEARQHAARMENLVQHYEQRNFELEEKEIESRCRAQMLEKTIPALKVYNTWKVANAICQSANKNNMTDDQRAHNKMIMSSSNYADNIGGDDFQNQNKKLKKSCKKGPYFDNGTSDFSRPSKTYYDSSPNDSESNDYEEFLQDKIKQLECAIKRKEELQKQSLPPEQKQSLMCKLQELKKTNCDLECRLKDLEMKETYYKQTLQQADEMWANMEGGYKEQLRELENKLEEKQNEIYEVEAMVRKMSGEKEMRQQLQERTCSLENEVKDFRFKIAEKECERKLLEKERLRLTEELGNTNEELSYLKVIIEPSLRQQLEEYKKISKEMKREIESLEKDRELDIEDRLAEVSGLKRKMNKMGKEILENECTIGELREEVQTLEMAVSELREKLEYAHDKHEREVMKMTMEIDDRNREITLLKEQSSHETKLPKSARQELEEAERQMQSCHPKDPSTSCDQKPQKRHRKHKVISPQSTLRKLNEKIRAGLLKDDKKMLKSCDLQEEMAQATDYYKKTDTTSRIPIASLLEEIKHSNHCADDRSTLDLRTLSQDVVDVATKGVFIESGEISSSENNTSSSAIGLKGVQESLVDNKSTESTSNSNYEQEKQISEKLHKHSQTEISITGSDEPFITPPQTPEVPITWNNLTKSSVHVVNNESIQSLRSTSEEQQVIICEYCRTKKKDFNGCVSCGLPLDDPKDFVIYRGHSQNETQDEIIGEIIIRRSSQSPEFSETGNDDTFDSVNNNEDDETDDGGNKDRDIGNEQRSNSQNEDVKSDDKDNDQSDSNNNGNEQGSNQDEYETYEKEESKDQEEPQPVHSDSLEVPNGSENSGQNDDPEINNGETEESNKSIEKDLETFYVFIDSTMNNYSQIKSVSDALPIYKPRYHHFTVDHTSDLFDGGATTLEPPFPSYSPYLSSDDQAMKHFKDGNGDFKLDELVDRIVKNNTSTLNSDSPIDKYLLKEFGIQESFSPSPISKEIPLSSNPNSYCRNLRQYSIQNKDGSGLSLIQSETWQNSTERVFRKKKNHIYTDCTENVKTEHKGIDKLTSGSASKLYTPNVNDSKIKITYAMKKPSKTVNEIINSEDSTQSQNGSLHSSGGLTCRKAYFPYLNKKLSENKILREENEFHNDDDISSFQDSLLFLLASSNTDFHGTEQDDNRMGYVKTHFEQNCAERESESEIVEPNQNVRINQKQGSDEESASFMPSDYSYEHFELRPSFKITDRIILKSFNEILIRNLESSALSLENNETFLKQCHQILRSLLESKLISREIHVNDMEIEGQFPEIIEFLDNSRTIKVVKNMVTKFLLYLRKIKKYHNELSSSNIDSQNIDPIGFLANYLENEEVIVIGMLFRQITKILKTSSSIEEIDEALSSFLNQLHSLESILAKSNTEFSKYDLYTEKIQKLIFQFLEGINDTNSIKEALKLIEIHLEVINNIKSVNQLNYSDPVAITDYRSILSNSLSFQRENFQNQDSISKEKGDTGYEKIYDIMYEIEQLKKILNNSLVYAVNFMIADQIKRVVSSFKDVSERLLYENFTKDRNLWLWLPNSNGEIIEILKLMKQQFLKIIHNINHENSRALLLVNLEYMLDDYVRILDCLLLKMSTENSNVCENSKVNQSLSSDRVGNSKYNASNLESLNNDYFSSQGTHKARNLLPGSEAEIVGCISAGLNNDVSTRKQYVKPSNERERLNANSKRSQDLNNNFSSDDNIDNHDLGSKLQEKEQANIPEIHKTSSFDLFCFIPDVLTTRPLSKKKCGNSYQSNSKYDANFELAKRTMNNFFEKINQSNSISGLKSCLMCLLADIDNMLELGTRETVIDIQNTFIYSSQFSPKTVLDLKRFIVMCISKAENSHPLESLKNELINFILLHCQKCYGSQGESSSSGLNLSALPAKSVDGLRVAYNVIESCAPQDSQDTTPPKLDDIFHSKPQTELLQLFPNLNDSVSKDSNERSNIDLSSSQCRSEIIKEDSHTILSSSLARDNVEMNAHDDSLHGDLKQWSSTECSVPHSKTNAIPIQPESSHTIVDVGISKNSQEDFTNIIEEVDHSCSTEASERMELPPKLYPDDTLGSLAFSKDPLIMLETRDYNIHVGVEKLDGSPEENNTGEAPIATENNDVSTLGTINGNQIDPVTDNIIEESQTEKESTDEKFEENGTGPCSLECRWPVIMKYPIATQFKVEGVPCNLECFEPTPMKYPLASDLKKEEERSDLEVEKEKKSGPLEDILHKCLETIKNNGSSNYLRALLNSLIAYQRSHEQDDGLVGTQTATESSEEPPEKERFHCDVCPAYCPCCKYNRADGKFYSNEDLIENVKECRRHSSPDMTLDINTDGNNIPPSSVKIESEPFNYQNLATRSESSAGSSSIKTQLELEHSRTIIDNFENQNYSKTIDSESKRIGNGIDSTVEESGISQVQETDNSREETVVVKEQAIEGRNISETLQDNEVPMENEPANEEVDNINESESRKEESREGRRHEEDEIPKDHEYEGKGWSSKQRGDGGEGELPCKHEKNCPHRRMFNSPDLDPPCENKVDFEPPSIISLVSSLKILRNKIVKKDQIIQCLADQLVQMGQAGCYWKNNMFECITSEPSKRYVDFDSAMLADYLAGLVYEKPSEQPCVYIDLPDHPLNLIVDGFVSFDAIRISWQPPLGSIRSGFDVYVNDELVDRIRDANGVTTILSSIDTRYVNLISVVMLDPQGVHCLMDTTCIPAIPTNKYLMCSDVPRRVISDSKYSSSTRFFDEVSKNGEKFYKNLKFHDRMNRIIVVIVPSSMFASVYLSVF